VKILLSCSLDTGLQRIQEVRVLDSMVAASDTGAQARSRVAFRFCRSELRCIILFVNKDLLLLKPCNNFFLVCVPLLYLAHGPSIVRRHILIFTLLVRSGTSSLRASISAQPPRNTVSKVLYSRSIHLHFPLSSSCLDLGLSDPEYSTRSLEILDMIISMHNTGCVHFQFYCR